MKKIVILEKTLEYVLEISPDIRFVAIAHDGNIHFKAREGIKSHLDDKQTQKSLDVAVKTWHEIGDFSAEIGKPLYFTTVYEKIKTITMGISECGVLLISIELSAEDTKLIYNLLEIKSFLKESLDDTGCS